MALQQKRACPHPPDEEIGASLSTQSYSTDEGTECIAESNNFPWIPFHSLAVVFPPVLCHSQHCGESGEPKINIQVHKSIRHCPL